MVDGRLCNCFRGRHVGMLEVSVRFVRFGEADQSVLKLPGMLGDGYRGSQRLKRSMKSSS